MPTAPLRPHLARELITRTARADEHWARLVRKQLTDEQVGAGRRIDHVNAGYLERTLQEYGWPDVPLVGENGARAAWRIALRADTRPGFQQFASRAMYGAVERGTASLPQWAHLYDRCLLGSGRPQFYGTQYNLLGSGGPQMLAVLGSAGDLDARRAAVGLPPFRLAAQRLRDRLAAEPRLDEEDDELSPVVLADAA
ncbi:DUF6624 domain-containing protein [Streptomyces sp. NPDC058861]|uniref:DUF6624 domain-containing protein n=1 Tax=Streptomyces sp. NPDC058861 TaxID=3346653 RepID=UPI0036C79436